MTFKRSTQQKTHNLFRFDEHSLEGIYFMVRHVDTSSLLIRSKHCENELGDCIYPGRLYGSYHEVYTAVGMNSVVLPTLFNVVNNIVQHC